MKHGKIKLKRSKKAMKNFNELPENIQKKVKEILTCYDECNVIFEYGEYKVSTGMAIKNHYAPDHKVIGYYNKNEIYTKEEQIINYVESFNDYPIEYKGKRDYTLLKKLETNKQLKVKIFEENIIIE